MHKLAPAMMHLARHNIHSQRFIFRRVSFLKKWLCCAAPQLPEGEHIRYVAYDFKAAAKRPGAGLLADIAPVIARCLDATGVFLCAPAPPGLAARRAGPIDWVRSKS